MNYYVIDLSSNNPDGALVWEHKLYDLQEEDFTPCHDYGMAIAPNDPIELYVNVGTSMTLEELRRFLQDNVEDMPWDGRVRDTKGSRKTIRDSTVAQEIEVASHDYE